MNDPWADLATPDEATRVSARRVDEHLQWNFYWAKGVDRKCLLILRHASDSQPVSRLPTLNGLEITETDADDGHDKMLVFRLSDSNQRTIFEQLCRDIVSATSAAESEREAVELALARTWRWHHLLRGGNIGRLSEEEQKGLIGELLVLERHLLSRFSPGEAMEAWRGPLDAPKDFEIGRTCIEAKARRGGATPFVAISSEHQLDNSGLDSLFLYVVDISSAPSSDTTAFTVTDIARRVRERVESVDQGVIELLDSRLLATGFDWQQDYSAFRWISGRSRIYRVNDGFPRLSAHDAPAGISNIRYSLSLMECEAFAATPEFLDRALTGAGNGN